MFSRVFASKHAARALWGATGAVGAGMVRTLKDMMTDDIQHLMSTLFVCRQCICSITSKLSSVELLKISQARLYPCTNK